MIIVRDIFQVKFGKMKDAKERWKEGVKLLAQPGGAAPRLLTDVTGQYYTLVLETAYRDLTEYEAFTKQEMSRPGMGAWYQSFVPLVESGRREIFSVVE